MTFGMLQLLSAMSGESFNGAVLKRLLYSAPAAGRVVLCRASLARKRVAAASISPGTGWGADSPPISGIHAFALAAKGVAEGDFEGGEEEARRCADQPARTKARKTTKRQLWMCFSRIKYGIPRARIIFEENAIARGPMRSAASFLLPHPGCPAGSRSPCLGSGNRSTLIRGVVKLKGLALRSRVSVTRIAHSLFWDAPTCPECLQNNSQHAGIINMSPSSRPLKERFRCTKVYRKDRNNLILTQLSVKKASAPCGLYVDGSRTGRKPIRHKKETRAVEFVTTNAIQNSAGSLLAFVFLNTSSFKEAVHRHHGPTDPRNCREMQQSHLYCRLRRFLSRRSGPGSVAEGSEVSRLLTIYQETPTTAPTAAGAPSASADPQPKPKPAPKVSATETTLKASRSIFRDAAERRYGDVSADAFHPAKQSTPLEASTQDDVRARRRLEGTKLVARKVYPKPDHNKLNDLADEQYVAKVQIPLDTAPEEINAAVLDKFTHIPAVAKYGFRVLRVKVPMVKVNGVWKKKKGTASYLVPLKGSLADTTVRKAGSAYKSLVFIALNPAGPNLTLYGTCESDSLDEDVETPVEDTDIELSGSESNGTTFKPTTPSSSEDDSSEDDTPAAKKQKNSQSSGRDIPRKKRAEPFEDDGMSMDEADNHSRGFASDNGVSEVREPSAPDKGKGKAKAEPDSVGNSEDNSEAAYGAKERDKKGKGKARDQSQFFSFEDNHFNTDESAPVHLAHIQMKRLLKNMSKPKIAQFWWLEKVPTQYKSLEALPMLISEWMTMTLEGDISVRKFYEYFRPRFLLPLAEVLNVGGTLPIPLTALGPNEEEAEFDSLFFIGPGGVDFFIAILDCIYLGIDRTYHLVQGDELCLAVIAEVGLRDNRMLAALKLLNVHQDSAETFTSKLTIAFGHAKDSKLMTKDVLIDGPHGLPHFYEQIVCYILDELEHPKYDDILSSAAASCTGLARKLTSHIKAIRLVPDPVHRILAPGPYRYVMDPTSDVRQLIYENQGDELGKGSAPVHKAKKSEEHFKKALSAISISSDTDEAPKAKSSRKQTRGFKAQSAPVQTKRSANSDTNNSKPETKKKRLFTDNKSEPDAPPKPQPSTKRPPPSKPKSPSTAGPSSGANFRPRPRPSYRGTPGYNPSDTSGNARFWGQFFSTPVVESNRRPEPGVDREVWEAEQMSSLPWPQLVNRILSRFPHPNRQQPDQTSFNGLSARAQFLRLSLIYHADHNGTQSADWCKISATIMQILNRRKP
ncbi:hypothetical protein DFH08DRAFT_988799 [Mycena albidolilacea]|uniref:Uncharacterized protein n=1 Tax=Mycena albidolilacea TaxID=1033008 RepID=A0AAD7E9A2_9AGAR|nr:hypothetical protein DFH08DRAFT_988799 [Mycena albidolilacea]